MQSRTFIGDGAVTLGGARHFVAVHPDLVLVLLLVELDDADGAKVLCDVCLRGIWRQTADVHHVHLWVGETKRLSALFGGLVMLDQSINLSSKHLELM